MLEELRCTDDYWDYSEQFKQVFLLTDETTEDKTGERVNRFTRSPATFCIGLLSFRNFLKLLA